MTSTPISQNHKRFLGNRITPLQGAPVGLLLFLFLGKILKDEMKRIFSLYPLTVVLKKNKKTGIFLTTQIQTDFEETVDLGKPGLTFRLI